MFSSTEVRLLPSLSFILQRLMALIMLKQVYEFALIFSSINLLHIFSFSRKVERQLQLFH